MQASVCDCVCVSECENGVAAVALSRRSHGSLMPPTLKVKAPTPRSRGGEGGNRSMIEIKIH